jgi:hypothetical protein
MTNSTILEQVTNFNYLGCQLVSNKNYDLQNTLQKFICLCGTIKRHIAQQNSMRDILKFYKFLALPSLLYGSKCWTLTPFPVYYFFTIFLK